MDLMTEISHKTRELETSIKMLRKSGEAYAKAYTEYRVALATELIKLKDEGYAITLAGDIARGKPSIAKLKFNEITTEAVYKGNLEAIQSIKLQLRLLENQVSREYGNTGNL